MLISKDTYLTGLLLPAGSSAGTHVKWWEWNLLHHAPVEMPFLTWWEEEEGHKGSRQLLGLQQAIWWFPWGWAGEAGKADGRNSEQVLLSWQNHLRIDNSIDSLQRPLFWFYSCTIIIQLSLSNLCKSMIKIRNKPHHGGTARNRIPTAIYFLLKPMRSALSPSSIEELVELRMFFMPNRTFYVWPVQPLFLIPPNLSCFFLLYFNCL